MNPQGGPTENVNVGQIPEGTGETEGARGVGKVVVTHMRVGRGTNKITPGGTAIVSPKAKGHIQIGFNNVNGMGMRANDDKNRDIQSFIASGDFDVFGITETNIHWKNNQQHVKEYTYGWFCRMHLAHQYYRDYPCDAKYQVGGVLQLAMGDIVSRVRNHGGDKTGQGRWTRQLFAGKKGRSLQIIMAYWPVRTQQMLAQYGTNNNYTPTNITWTVIHRKDGSHTY
jgi:hypothetical protein